mgnify:FL=1
MQKTYTLHYAGKLYLNIDKRKLDIDEILAKLRKLAVDLRIAPLEFGYRKNEDGSIDLIHGGCPYFEGCNSSWEVHFLENKGRIVCGATVFVTQFLKIGTGQEWDHAILEFGEPRCIVRCFPI